MHTVIEIEVTGFMNAMSTPHQQALKQTLLLLSAMAATILVGCAASSGTVPQDAAQKLNRDTSQLLVVDCLLPGQLRRLGQIMTFLTPRRPIKTSASECEIRGGEYVAYDRANFATALKIWLPRAQEGDAEAQTYVGEIYEKGLGLEPDLELAANWYRRAADQGHSRAQINLGYLYESGLGVERDLTIAMNFYRAASGFTDGNLEYVTAIEVANRKARKRQVVDLKQQVAELEEANEKLKQKQASLDNQQTELLRLRKEIEKQRSVVISAALAQPAEDEDNSSRELSAALVEIDSLGSQLAESETERGRLVRSLEEQQRKTGDVRQQFAAANTELNSARENLGTREQSIARLTDELKAMAVTTEQANDELASQARKDLEAQLANEQRLAAELTTELESLRQSRSKQTGDIEQRLQLAEAEEAELKRQLDAATTETARLQPLLASQEQNYQQELGRLAQQLDSVRQQATAQSQDDAARIARLEDTNLSINASAQQQQTVVDDMQLQLEQLRARLDAGNDSAEELVTLRQQSDTLTTELAAAKSEQERLTERLMEGGINAQTDRQAATLKLAGLERDLQNRQQTITSQRNEITDLQARVSRTRAAIDEPEIEQIINVVDAGPSIEIIEPPVTLSRGKPALSTASGLAEIKLIGRVSPHESLLAFQINGEESQINDNGVFTYKINTSESSSLRFVAINDAGERTEMEFGVAGNVLSEPVESTEQPALDTRSIDFGNYHALIIGNNQYDHLHDLRTAENDAIAIERVLRTRYGFKTELVLNANRYELLSALNRKRDELTEKDNLLIYYAGHGELSNDKGYWMPTDAEPGSTSNWVSNSSITDLVESMSAKHVMIVADSCYSGSLSRSSLTRLNTGMTTENKLNWYKSIAASKVRTVLTSGGIKPVIDSTANSRHSLFAEALLDELANADGIVEAYALYLKVQNKVKAEAKKLSVEQDPQYSPIRFAGHESGEFLFITSEVGVDDADGQSAKLTGADEKPGLLSALAQ
jgi:hypothetical protein